MTSTWPGRPDLGPSSPDVSVGRVLKDGTLAIKDQSGIPDSTGDGLIELEPEADKSIVAAPTKPTGIVSLDEVQERMQGDPEWYR